MIHIAISSNALSYLLERGQIHAMDFRCLNKESKKIVWKLLLNTLKTTIKNNLPMQGARIDV